MQDLIETVRSAATRNGVDPDRKWTVKFVDGETYTGIIERLGFGNYGLITDSTTYYFHVDKVMRLYSE